MTFQTHRVRWMIILTAFLAAIIALSYFGGGALQTEDTVKTESQNSSQNPKAVILLYTKATCPYCRKAKELLDQKQLAYEEIDLLVHPDKRDEMIAKSNGGTTVPQIFIQDHHIGGFSELWQLEETGELDKLVTTSHAAVP